jgi:hypothetical protein
LEYARVKLGVFLFFASLRSRVGFARGVGEAFVEYSGRVGLGDSSVNLIPDTLVGLVTKDRIQERFDAVDVEIVGADGGQESDQITEEILAAAGRKETRHRKEL